MKKALFVGLGLWWSMGTALAEVTEVFIYSLKDGCTMEEAGAITQEYTEWMAAHEVVGHSYQFDFSHQWPFAHAYAARAASAETLMKATAAFNTAVTQADSAEAKLVARAEECYHWHAHWVDAVVGPAIEVKPGYYQVRVIEPKCSVTTLSTLTQRFGEMFEVDVELRTPMDGAPSQTTYSIIGRWADEATYGRAWDRWNAGEGKELQAFQAEWAACATTVDGATVRMVD